MCVCVCVSVRSGKEKIRNSYRGKNKKSSGSPSTWPCAAAIVISVNWKRCALAAVSGPLPGATAPPSGQEGKGLSAAGCVLRPPPCLLHHR